MIFCPKWIVILCMKENLKLLTPSLPKPPSIHPFHPFSPHLKNHKVARWNLTVFISPKEGKTYLQNHRKCLGRSAPVGPSDLKSGLETTFTNSNSILIIWFYHVSLSGTRELVWELGSCDWLVGWISNKDDDVFSRMLPKCNLTYITIWKKLITKGGWATLDLFSSKPEYIQETWNKHLSGSWMFLVVLSSSWKKKEIVFLSRKRGEMPKRSAW